MSAQQAQMSDRQERLHIICERDVGLFSLIQQVISTIPWALAESRTPVVCFGRNTCYWTPNGYHGKDTVWEYYFEPLIPEYPAARIPAPVRAWLSANSPSAQEVGHPVGPYAFASSHFGDHPALHGKTLRIPYQWEDPDRLLRQEAKLVIDRFIRPREYILHKADTFFRGKLAGHPLIGVHARGTDATSAQEIRPFRQGSLALSRYVAEIQRLLEASPGAKIFVASDDQGSVDHLVAIFGDRVVAHDSLRHRAGEPAGQGPTGWIMPAYICGDRDAAASNGEEAVIEYLLLSRCSYLVHNGSSLARTVLLNAPWVPHTNTHRRDTQQHRPNPQQQSSELVAAAGGDIPAGRAQPAAGRNRVKAWGREEAPMTAVNPETIARVKAEKKRRRALPGGYQDRPRLAFIVQSFNRVANIEQLAEGLRAMGEHELIVCEDGSFDGSLEKWLSYIGRRNDFLIRSNDLHEIRILDRAIRFSRAEIVCLVQDDDQIPCDRAWVERALQNFARHPRLAIIGGFMGFECFDPDPAKARRVWGGEEFRFIQHVNIGPYFLRKQYYEELGGWEYSFSEVGEPGICFDNELCLRAWLKGYQVGYCFVPFKGPAGHYPADGGTVLFDDEIRVRNSVRNSDTIFARYGRYAAVIDRMVAEANAGLRQPRDGQAG